MTVRKLSVLDISTAHITHATSKLLQETPLKDWPTTGGETQYGYFIYACDCYDECIPPDLWAVMCFAHANGCDYICLDADAEQYEELPSYDWDSFEPIFPEPDKPLNIIRMGRNVPISAIFFDEDQANKHMETASPEQGVIATYGTMIVLAECANLGTEIT